MLRGGRVVNHELMSVRIHQISKKTGIANKELIALLKERGYNVTSASSSIDNISAESLVEELTGSAAPAGEAEPDKPREESGEAAAAEEAPREEKEPSAPTPGGLPPGVFVKSADDVRREREEKEEAKKKARGPAPTPAAPPPPPPPAKSGPPPPPRPAP